MWPQAATLRLEESRARRRGCFGPASCRLPGSPDRSYLSRPYARTVMKPPSSVLFGKPDLPQCVAYRIPKFGFAGMCPNELINGDPRLDFEYPARSCLTLTGPTRLH